MAKQQQSLEPIGPGLTFEAREANAAGYVAKMAGYANAGLLSASTLLRLQMPSQTVQGLGLPDLVLAKNGQGKWVVVDRRVAEEQKALPESVTVTVTVTEPAVTHGNAPENVKSGASIVKSGPLTPAEKQKAYRGRKRAQREREKGTTE